MLNLTTDEELVLIEFRKLAHQRHGDIEVSVKDGKLVKIWRVEKIDLADHRKIREICTGA